MRQYRTRYNPKTCRDSIDLNATTVPFERNHGPVLAGLTATTVVHYVRRMEALALPAVLALALIGGCAVGSSSLQQPTAKAIGCAPDDVQIAQDMGGFGGRTWIAHCGERRYSCSSRQSDQQAVCELDP